MTTFRLKRKEAEAEGIRRVAHGRAGDAVERLRDADADPVEAVHESRKDLKKLRATLRLVRPALGRRGLRAGERPLPGRGPGAVRRPRCPGQGRHARCPRGAIRRRPSRAAGGPCARWSSVTTRLTSQSLPPFATASQSRSSRATSPSTKMAARGGWLRAVAAGTEEGLLARKQEKTLRDARDDPADEPLHEWRKRSKDLWYHLRLVSCAWPEVLKATAPTARTSSPTASGDDHDLVVPDRLPENEAPALTTTSASTCQGRDPSAARGAPGRGLRLRGAPVRREAEALRRADQRYWDARQF